MNHLKRNCLVSSSALPIVLPRNEALRWNSETCCRIQNIRMIRPWAPVEGLTPQSCSTRILGSTINIHSFNKFLQNVCQVWGSGRLVDLGRNVPVDFSSPVPTVSCLQPHGPLPSPVSNAVLLSGSGLLLAPTGCPLLGQSWFMVADYLASLFFLRHWFHCQPLCFHCWTHKGPDKHPLELPVRLYLELLSFIVIHFLIVMYF